VALIRETTPDEKPTRKRRSLSAIESSILEGFLLTNSIVFGIDPSPSPFSLKDKTLIFDLSICCSLLVVDETTEGAELVLNPNADPNVDVDVDVDPFC